MIDKLIKVCEKHVIPASALTVVSEPYIPFIPAKWNGVLVLAENQNLSKENASYEKWLNQLSSHDRMIRLNLRDTLGIQIWDDGTLKLAVEAALKFKASEVAVSKAVLWSLVGANDKNNKPDEKLQNLSSELWKELLPIINPALLISCGKIAKGVIDATGWTGKRLALRLSYSSALSRASGMSDEEDMLSRYPEVKAAAIKHPDWVSKPHRLTKLLFACHLVSLAKVNRIKERLVKEGAARGEKEEEKKNQGQ